MSRTVVIASGVRTAIGDFGGSLAGISPCDLGASVAREAIARAGISASDIDQTVFGHVIHTAPEDMYISRVAAIRAGVPETAPAMTLNRLCGSGLQALSRAGLEASDLDVIESNEAFAVQACAVSAELGFAAEKVNPNGGAIALGHPVGASGAIILIKTIYELKRTGGRFGLATMCIGGGQGIAMIVENPDHG